MKLKDIIIVVLAGAALLVSGLLQPWAELGFGFDKSAITDRSLMSVPLNALVGACAGFSDVGKWCQETITSTLNKEAQENGLKPDPDWNKPTLVGDYAYILFMGFSMTAAGIAIMLIGREDAEEKTILPVKK